MFLYQHILVVITFSFAFFLCTAVAPGSSQKLMRISLIMRRKSRSTVKAFSAVTWKKINKKKKMKLHK